MPANLRELDAEIARLAAEISSRMARWLDLIGQFDAAGLAAREGFRSTSDWLAWRCGIDPRTARQHVHAARRLRQMPAVHEAFISGELSYSKVRALARAPEEADERELLDVATTSSAARLEQHVRSLRSAPSADPEAARRAHERRYLDWRWDRDGALEVHGRLTPDDGAALIEVIETAAAALHPATADPPPPGLGARRADALGEIARSGAPRAQVRLHVDLPALACSAEHPSDRAGETCHLHDGPAIPSETARRLTCDADLTLLDPGANLDLGRTSRVVSPQLRTYLERRDGGCRFPGCHRRHGLSAHHIIHWALGGKTDRDNLLLLCHFHHRLMHEEGFTARRERGTVVYRRPDGSVVREAGETPLALVAA